MNYMLMRNFFLISMLFCINSVCTSIDSIDSTQIVLAKKYYFDKKCDLVNEYSDYGMQEECFKIAEELLKISDNKKYVWIIAQHYLKGIGIKKDIVKGLKFYEEVANSDYNVANDAQYILAIYYGADDNIKNLEKSEYWLKKAAINNNPDAQCDYATLLWEQSNHKEALGWYKEAIKNNNPKAKSWLAALFSEGHDVGITRQEAYQLLHSAANQNYPLAFYNLGIMYKEDGDKEKSNYWYCRLVQTDFFKDVAMGMDKNDAINKAIFIERHKQLQKELNRNE
jgi:TPR repeat protein